MTGLGETCPVHLVKGHVKVMGCESCHEKISAYGVFKSALEFKPWTYCFHCGLPQDKNHNSEQPRCHALYQFKKGGKPCKYAGYIFKVVACMAEDTTMRHWMEQQMDMTRGMNMQEVGSWASKEAGEGKYSNLIEVFILFCEQLEKNDSRFFMTV